jgi:hypothetical protein
MTLYERIALYCKTHQVSPPSPKKRSDLGEAVAKKCAATGKVSSFEYGRFIQVNDYPESVYPAIDSLIQKLYENGKKADRYR